MTWTYTNNPSSEPRDAVRLLVGDTDDCDQLLQDEEIDFFLNTFKCAVTASIHAATALAAKFSRNADESVGQVKISFSQRAKSYHDLADHLRHQLHTHSGTIIAGGISRIDKDRVDSNTDRVEPFFKRQQFSNPRKGPSFFDGKKRR